MNNSINLLLVERYDTIRKILLLAKDKKIELSQSDIDAINQFERVEDFQQFDKVERDKKILNFVHSSHNVLNQINSNNLLNDNQNYRDLCAKSNDIEEIYRQKSSKYNSDVIGYNYWIHMYSLRWLFRLFKMFPKDSIV